MGAPCSKTKEASNFPRKVPSLDELTQPCDVHSEASHRDRLVDLTTRFIKACNEGIGSATNTRYQDATGELRNIVALEFEANVADIFRRVLHERVVAGMSEKVPPSLVLDEIFFYIWDASGLQPETVAHWSGLEVRGVRRVLFCQLENVVRVPLVASACYMGVFATAICLVPIGKKCSNAEGPLLQAMQSILGSRCGDCPEWGVYEGSDGFLYSLGNFGLMQYPPAASAAFPAHSPTAPIRCVSAQSSQVCILPPNGARSPTRSTPMRHKLAPPSALSTARMWTARRSSRFGSQSGFHVATWQ